MLLTLKISFSKYLNILKLSCKIAFNKYQVFCMIMVKSIILYKAEENI